MMDGRSAESPMDAHIWNMPSLHRISDPMDRLQAGRAFLDQCIAREMQIMTTCSMALTALQDATALDQELNGGIRGSQTCDSETAVRDAVRSRRFQAGMMLLDVRESCEEAVFALQDRKEHLSGLARRFAGEEAD